MLNCKVEYNLSLQWLFLRGPHNNHEQNNNNYFPKFL